MDEFRAVPHPDIRAAMYASGLLDLLQQEAYISKDLTLLQVFSGDPYADATRLLGFIAEAMVVKLCNENPAVNRKLSMLARFGNRAVPNLDKYFAIGTGLSETKSNYKIHYSPCDPQRDIIWVRKDNPSSALPCVDASPYPATPAGLQVKASGEGAKYVVPGIKNYFFPILYFDLSNDWATVYKLVSQAGYGHLMVPLDDMLCEIREELRHYHHLIVQLLRNERTIADLANIARWEDPVLLAGLIASEVQANSSIIILG